MLKAKFGARLFADMMVFRNYGILLIYQLFLVLTFKALLVLDPLGENYIIPIDMSWIPYIQSHGTDMNFSVSLYVGGYYLASLVGFLSYVLISLWSSPHRAEWWKFVVGIGVFALLSLPWLVGSDTRSLPLGRLHQGVIFGHFFAVFGLCAVLGITVWTALARSRFVAMGGKVDE